MKRLAIWNSGNQEGVFRIPAFVSSRLDRRLDRSKPDTGAPAEPDPLEKAFGILSQKFHALELYLLRLQKWLNPNPS